MVLLPKNSQIFGLLSQKNRVSFYKEPWNVSKMFQNYGMFIIVTIVCTMRIKWYFCSKNLKMFKNWVFFRRKCFFSKKSLEMFQNREMVKMFPESVSNGITAQEFSESSEFWVFFWKKFFFRERTLECFENSNCEKCF